MYEGSDTPQRTANNTATATTMDTHHAIGNLGIQ